MTIFLITLVIFCQLDPNLVGMFIGWFYEFFFADRNCTKGVKEGVVFFIYMECLYFRQSFVFFLNYLYRFLMALNVSKI